MLYRNVRTGAMVKTPCKITGKNWELVEEIHDDALEDDITDDVVEEETDDDTVEEETDDDTVEETPAEKPRRTRRGGK